MQRTQKAAPLIYGEGNEIRLYTTRSFISNGKPGKLYIGGGFDDGKIQEYKNELKSRVFLCDKLPKLTDGLIQRVKKLT